MCAHPDDYGVHRARRPAVVQAQREAKLAALEAETDLKRLKSMRHPMKG